MPAFKLKQRIFFSEFERGRKAHGYVPDSRLFPSRNKSNVPDSRLFPSRISRTILIRRFLAQPPFQKKQPHRPQKTEGHVVFAVGEVLVEGKTGAKPKRREREEARNCGFVKAEVVREKPCEMSFFAKHDGWIDEHERDQQ